VAGDLAGQGIGGGVLGAVYAAVNGRRPIAAAVKLPQADSTSLRRSLRS